MKRTEAHKGKISAKMTGKKLSQEVKDKIRKSKLDKIEFEKQYLTDLESRNNFLLLENQSLRNIICLNHSKIEKNVMVMCI